ncbi:TIGR03619 family F420-dependent LLM class oxidoreductase [Mycolicibacterium sp. CBM1]
MRLGCDVPYFGSASEIRDFAQAVEELGYDTLNFSEHVAATRDSPFPPGFSFDDPWHEAFTHAAYLAAVTRRVEISTSMMLLTTRPTVLAAKQAAEVQLLSEGRLRLGVSVGWNGREVEVLGQQRAERGRRLEEQIEVMRLLWCQPSVDFSGRFHQLEGVGISPRPAVPIPVWVGGGSFGTGGVPTDAVLRRIVRCADGYKMFAPLGAAPAVALRVVNRLRSLAEEIGRDPRSIGVEARLLTHVDPPETWAATAERWALAGVDRIGLGNRILGGTVDQQLSALSAVIKALC